MQHFTRVLFFSLALVLSLLTIIQLITMKYTVASTLHASFISL